MKKHVKKLLSYPYAKTGLIFLGLIVALFAYYFYAMSTTVQGPVPVVEVTATDHVRGAQGGKVTLVEFGDFQCPACAAYEPLVRQIVAANPDTLSFVFRHYPLTAIHRNALLAAKASEAAALQGKFWEMHDVLYDRQKEWGETLNAREIILSYATELGLDMQKFSVDIDSSAIEDKIVAEYREGVRLKVQGTPTFFLNGKMIESPQSFEAFDKLIKEAAVNAQ